MDRKKRTDLHAATQAKDEVKGGLLLNVVIGEGAAILELLAREDQTLLVGRNALLVLDLRLDIVDGVAGLHLKGDRLAGNCKRELVTKTASGKKKPSTGCSVVQHDRIERCENKGGGKLTSLDKDLHNEKSDEGSCVDGGYDENVESGKKGVCR